MTKPRFSLNPATIGQCDFEKSLEIARQAGFEGIGLRHNLLADYLGRGRTPAQAAELIEKSGLTTTEAGFLAGWMFHGGVPLAGKRARSGESREQLLREMEEFFQLVGELGAPPLTALVATQENGDLDQAGRDLAWLCDRAGKHGLRIMVELIGNAPLINSVRQARRLMEAAGKDNCGLLLDSFLMFLGEFDLDEVSRLPGERIYTVHLSDAPAGKARGELDMLRDRLFPGAGAIPLRELVQAVQATGYRGWYTVEIFNPDYNQRDPLEIAQLALGGMERLFG